MTSLLMLRTTLIWFVLMVATGLSWGMGHGFGIADLRFAGIAILIVTFVKVRFVMLEFMELRSAPAFMRLGAQAWAAVICVILIVLFLNASH
jgi:hypothetical protein